MKRAAARNAIPPASQTSVQQRCPRSSRRGGIGASHRFSPFNIQFFGSTDANLDLNAGVAKVDTADMLNKPRENVLKNGASVIEREPAQRRAKAHAAPAQNVGHQTTSIARLERTCFFPGEHCRSGLQYAKAPPWQIRICRANRSRAPRDYFGRFRRFGLAKASEPALDCPSADVEPRRLKEGFKPLLPRRQSAMPVSLVIRPSLGQVSLDAVENGEQDIPFRLEFALGGSQDFALFYRSLLQMMEIGILTRDCGPWGAAGRSTIWRFYLHRISPGLAFCPSILGARYQLADRNARPRRTELFDHKLATRVAS